MADTISISLHKREVTGKAVKRLRQEGLVPAVIHDHGKPSVVVSGDYMDMARIFRRAGRHHPVVVDADGKKYTTLIKAVARDPRKNTLTHVVFNAIEANQKVEAEIPVRVRYDEGNDISPAERNGLIVLHQLEMVEVVALLNDLPPHLEFNGEKLVEVGDTATVGDLTVPKGVEIKTELTHQLASVFEPSALAAANEEAGGDAEIGDESSVTADHESGAVEGAQAGELRPGGKKEFEDKEQGHNPEKK
jgi:large subunit ribosomal protein L25